MDCRLRMISLTIAAVCLAALPVHAQSAADSFTQGKALLAEGQLQPALQAFAAAVRADRNNQEYMQQYALLRQIIDLRARLEGERDAQRWEYVARALHSYYFSQAMYPMALELSQQMSARLKDSTSALLVAETALAMNKNDVAAEALSALEESQQSTSSRALLGVALAREGKLAEAKKIAQGLELSTEEQMGVLYSAARLQSVVGDTSAAMATLTKCFESTPPSRLEGLKQYARQCADFGTIASTPAFAQVLQTGSKIAESKCSGGSGCANCPMRGNCQQPQK